MRLTSSDAGSDDDSGLVVDYLVVTLGEFEHVNVILPDGRRVVVFADKINVSEPGAPRTQDGKRVWPS